MSLTGIFAISIVALQEDTEDVAAPTGVRDEIELYSTEDRLEIAAGFAITIFGIIFLLNMMLLTGVQRNLPSMINAWFITNSILFVLYFLAFFCSIFYAARKGDDLSLGLIFATAIRCGLQVYFLTVVYCYRYVLVCTLSGIPTIKVESPHKSEKIKTSKMLVGY